MKKIYLILGIILTLAILGCSAEEQNQPVSEVSRSLTQSSDRENLFIKLQADLICRGYPLDAAGKEVLTTEEHQRLFGTLEEHGLQNIDEYESLLEEYGDNYEIVKAALDRTNQICPDVYREMMGL